MAEPPKEIAVEATALKLGYRLSSGKIVKVLDDLDLRVEAGEFLAVIGPSGCGKSTLLRAVADLVSPLSGSLQVFGSEPSLARHSRDVGFVFQDATLLPWRTALENVTLPREVGPQSRPLSEAPSANELLDLLGIGELSGRYPGQLSGGQRQRVAIARALLTRPRILLMDEPFGALDEITRDRLNDELLKLWRRTGTTILFVTHSIMEAAYLGRKVLLLAANPGRIKTILDLKPIKGPNGECSREDPALVSTMKQLRAQLAAC
jgi:NitT/TauT family transport system ATP-binding protein